MQLFVFLHALLLNMKVVLAHVVKNLLVRVAQTAKKMTVAALSAPLNQQNQKSAKVAIKILLAAAHTGNNIPLSKHI